jgi:hypothetical protein
MNGRNYDALEMVGMLVLGAVFVIGFAAGLLVATFWK